MGYRAHAARLRSAGLSVSVVMLSLLWGCDGATNPPTTDLNEPRDTQFLTLDDEEDLENGVDPAVYGDYAIRARRVADDDLAWSFEVVADAPQPSPAGLRFVWDFGVPNAPSQQGMSPSFTFPAGGSYTVRVTALDAADQTVFVLTLDIEVPESGPVPLAGDDLTVLEGEQVCLRGRTAGDDAAVELSWAQLAGPVVLLSSAGEPGVACFAAPAVDVDTRLVFALTATDGDTSAEDTITVEVADTLGGAGVLVADAGADQSVSAGDPVTLDGSGSSGSGQAALRYLWNQLAGPSVRLSRTDQPTVTFTAPDPGIRPQVLAFRLTVIEGEVSALDEVQITVMPGVGGGGGGIGGGGGGGVVDHCPLDPDKTDPGVCGCGIPDVDTDGDGVFDCHDACPEDADKFNPGACGCGAADGDRDGDGVADCVDGCPNDPDKSNPGACGCGESDADADGDGTPDCLDPCSDGVDSDGDGTADCAEACPLDPDKLQPGICGCGVPDTDADGDGVADCVDDCFAGPDQDGDGTLDCEDLCPLDEHKTAPGACGCGQADVDSDGDGALDCVDACPADGNKTAPGVCGCDVPDDDSDGDGTADCNDGCPADPAKTAPGACGCGVSDADSDGDGAPDCSDRCDDDPAKTAPGACGCGVSDADSDGDGTPDCLDACPADSEKTEPGVCGCGTPDVDADGDGVWDCNDDCSGGPDSDGDGVLDCEDGCPADADKTSPGLCGCGVSDDDSDGDGTADCRDACPADAAKTAPGACGCGVSDADSDGDGTPDCNDGCPTDAAKTVPGACGCGASDIDADGNGVADCHDAPAGMPLSSFQAYACGDEPDDWYDTAANNSMAQQDGLFQVLCLGAERAFGTTSTATNIHAHYVGAGAAQWSTYTYTGRMRLADTRAGIGVTFFSDYPNSDAYYRIRRGDWSGGRAFMLGRHPDDVTGLAGTLSTAVTPAADAWYRFRIEVEDTGPRTEIRAKFWAEGAAEPSDWQIDAYDASSQRLRAGTVGVWSMAHDAKYWDDLRVQVADCDVDGDGDGVVDCQDGCPADGAKTEPGICGCGVSDADADGDGVADCHDPCSGGPDSDGDGALDCEDACAGDPNKTTPGVCGCGVSDADSDGDGVADCVDQCPDESDADADGDGVPNCIDACPGHDDGADADGDGTPDGCDEAQLAISQVALNFGAVANTATFEIWNAGGGSVSYAVTDNAAWLSVAPAAGSSTGERDLITATVDRGTLSTGSHEATVTVTPSTGPARQLAVTALVQPPGEALTPIARWDVVPRQRISAGEALNVGVVAFSKFGIAKVRFEIDGQGYTGPTPVDVTEMTYNPRTNVWEYWTPIAADDFTGDGAISVEAVVYGNDGGIRDKNTAPGDGLEALTLFVNPHGTLPSNTAWVAPDGSDGTGQINNPSRPFARISAAMQALASHQGGAADGAVVRLRPGHYNADGGGIYGDETAHTANEWITITSDPDAGGSRANTFIDSRSSGDLTSYWLKVEDLTLAAPAIINGGNSADADRWNRSVWLSNCHLPGGSGDFPFPVGSGWRGPQYFTECTIDNMRRASGNGQNHKLMRNLTITNTREDVFQSVPFGVNIRVDGCDPGPVADPEHADVIQGPPALATEGAFIHNWIWYNVIATDLHYQGIFVRSGATSQNNAFVNCLFEMRAPIRNDVSGRGTTFAGRYDHLLVWHCSFLGTGTVNKFNLGQYESTTSPSNIFQLDNVSVRGCLFERFRSGVSSNDLSWIHDADVEIRDNHYISTDTSDPNLLVPTSDAGRTTGDPQVVTDPDNATFGRPASSASPLVGRISPVLIPADAEGRAYGATADVGACRH